MGCGDNTIHLGSIPHVVALHRKQQRLQHHATLLDSAVGSIHHITQAGGVVGIIPEHDDEGLSAASQSLIMMGADSAVGSVRHVTQAVGVVGMIPAALSITTCKDEDPSGDRGEDHLQVDDLEVDEMRLIARMPDATAGGNGASITSASSPQQQVESLAAGSAILPTSHVLPAASPATTLLWRGILSQVMCIAYHPVNPSK
jgi:hypothetical protein